MVPNLIIEAIIFNTASVLILNISRESSVTFKSYLSVVVYYFISI
jgi:hypothetical protein